MDLGLGDVDVMDCGVFAVAGLGLVSAAVAFWNLDQFGRCRHRETLLGCNFLAGCRRDVKTLFLGLFRADRLICVEANIFGLSFTEPVGKCAKATIPSIPGDVEADVLSLGSRTFRLVNGETLPARNLSAVVDGLALALLHRNHFRQLDTPRVWLHRALLAVDCVTAWAWGSPRANRLRHKVANLFVPAAPVDILALLHLVDMAVAGTVTLEAHLVLNLATVRLLEMDALLFHLHSDGGLANADRLGDALHLGNVGANLFTLRRAALLSLHGTTLLVGTIQIWERARGCKICVNT